SWKGKGAAKEWSRSKMCSKSWWGKSWTSTTWKTPGASDDALAGEPVVFPFIGRSGFLCHVGNGLLQRFLVRLGPASERKTERRARLPVVVVRSQLGHGHLVVRKHPLQLGRQHRGGSLFPGDLRAASFFSRV